MLVARFRCAEAMTLEPEGGCQSRGYFFVPAESEHSPSFVGIFCANRIALADAQFECRRLQ
jgi:hypothetical protein